ncbi:MAG: hypothetical protein EBS59_09435 [Verrucomicrobia bacterium]|nr:hypothetical protein [Verrucomicrobiota bacterium]
MRVIEIENCYFTNNSLCPKIFGTIEGYYKSSNKKINFEFNNIKQSCKLHYDKTIKQYSLYIPEKIITIKNNDIKDKNNIIGIDLGLRTFMTCLSNNEAINIGNTSKSVLKNLIKKQTYIKTNLKEKKIKMTNKIRKKLLKINKRIKGFIDEMHWKSIKFLTDNYKNILIGDLSTKGIVCNDKSILKGYNKNLAYALSFHKYRERLKYKCSIKNCNYIKVNEYYTSKTCSMCTNVHEKLGSSKIFKCSKCNLEIDRDINGCRNIILKCL